MIMDEPTSSLEPREVERLLAVVALLKEHGVAIVYVSHKLDEVFARLRHDHRAARRQAGLDRPDRRDRPGAS